MADSHWYVESLVPMKMTSSPRDALKFTLEDAERTIYSYGLRDDYIVEEYIN